MVIVKTLERAGHSATVVNDGEAALDALEENHFDLVLMDLNMPVMNGIEATKLYRFSSIGLPHVPIVALTADATTDAWARCKEAGMDGYVTKPIEPARLLDVIDSVLSRPEVIQVQNVEDTTVSMADRIAASKIENLIENVVVGFEDAVREPVVAHELPDVLDRIELGRFRRQRQERDVVRDGKLRRDMPPGLIEKNERMRAWCDRKRDFFEMQGHGLAVAGG